MAQSQGLAGNQFPGNIVDQFSIELHDPITYLTSVYSASNINLNTSGIASVNIPISFSGSYYVTVKQRNSIGVVTSSPVSFSTPAVSYDFSTSATQAFGSNLKNLGAGVFGIYSGDVNQDGIIDLGDLVPVFVQSSLASSGYMPEDVNGDGLVDLTDLVIVFINSSSAIGIITP
jgi:hypothetical protein